MKFISAFTPAPGDSRDEVLEKFERMLGQLRAYVKDGYEHDSADCESVTVVDGEPRGGWVDPRSGTCSTCGFFVGDLRLKVAAIESLVDTIRAYPPEWRFAVGKVPPPPEEKIH